MQRSGKSAEPSMEEILASIRKIISDEPAADTSSDVPPTQPHRASQPQEKPAEPAPAPRSAASPAPADLDDDLADILGQPAQTEPSPPAAAAASNPFRKAPAAPTSPVAEKPAPADEPTFARSPFPPKSSRETAAPETPAEPTQTNPFGLPPQAKVRPARAEGVPPVPKAPTESDANPTGKDTPFAGRLADRLRTARPEPEDTKPVSAEANPFGRRPASPSSDAPTGKPAATSPADSDETSRADELAALAALRSPEQTEEDTSKDASPSKPAPRTLGEAAGASPKPVAAQWAPEPTTQKPAQAQPSKTQPAEKAAADKPVSQTAGDDLASPKPAEPTPARQSAIHQPAAEDREAEPVKAKQETTTSSDTPATSQKTFAAVDSALAVLAATPTAEASVDKPVAEAKADRPQAAPEVSPKSAPETAKAAAPEAATSRTLEDAVADLLRPMLSDWLDANLPRIVEKALRDELAKRNVSGTKPDEPGA